MRRFSQSVFLTAAACALTAAGSANAQMGGGGGSASGGGGGCVSGGGRGSILRLIGYPEVQEDLQLDEQQKERVEELKRECSDLEREVFFNPPDPSEESPFSVMRKMMERMERLEEKNADASKQIQNLLTSEQRQRIEQIVLQAQGAEALFRPDIAEALRITPAQQRRLETMRQQAAWQSHQLISKAHAGREEHRAQVMLEAMEKAAKVQDQVGKRMLGQVLTARQKARLSELEGEKLELAGHGSFYAGGGGISGGSSGGFSGGSYGASGGGGGVGSSGGYGGRYGGAPYGGARYGGAPYGGFRYGGFRYGGSYGGGSYGGCGSSSGGISVGGTVEPQQPQ